MLRYPQIDPIALKLGPVQIHWYGIMYVLGFAAAWWLARKRAARPGSTWQTNDVDDLIFWAMLGVIIGGRLGYVLFYGTQFWATDPWYPLKIWQGGMSFHGALLGVLISLALFAWRRRRNVLDVMDFTAPLPGLGIMAGRLGNFINGELWGRETTVPWGFVVPDAVGSSKVLHPSQLYEALFEGLLLFVLLWWYSSRPRARGTVLGLGLMYYAVVRFLVEFLRVPDAQIGYVAWGWLTRGQQLSVPMFIAGLLLCVLAKQPTGNQFAKS
ncbi:MAG: prolipoprotein diacylglyceryl transferase [Pseudomonadota bacterium]